MRHGIVVGFIALALGFAASDSRGEALATNLLYQDGLTITQLEDDDWESLGGSNDSIVDVGEYIYGMFQIVKVRDASPGTQPDRPQQADMFAGVFVCEVASIVDSPIFGGVKGRQYVLAPASDAAWAALGLTRADQNTMLAVYSDPDGPEGMVDPAALGGVNASLDTATNGTLLWEFGLTGAAGEHWYTDVFSLSGNPLNFAQMSILMNEAALNVTATGAGTPLDVHDFLGLGDSSQIQFTGGLESYSAGNFTIRTDSDFYVKAVPEPGTLALLIFGALALAAGRLRRRAA